MTTALTYKARYKFAKLIWPVSSTVSKHQEELAYWEERKVVEGDLENGWYRDGFTTAFGLREGFFAGKRMLDVGCGPRGSLEWADMALERVGLDPLANAYRRLNRGQAMRYVKGGSESIPFLDNYFDVVSSFNSLDHVDDVDQSVREITRVLRPGGTLLLISDVNHEPTRAEPHSYSFDVLEKFGDRYRLENSRQLEKVGTGAYSSAEANIAWDSANTTRRYGVLVARLTKI